MHKLLTKGFLSLICLLFCCGTGFCQRDTMPANPPSVTADSLIESIDSAFVISADSLAEPVADSFRYPGNPRMVPEKQVKAYRRDPDFAYANDPAYWQKKPATSPNWLIRMLKLLLSPDLLLPFFILMIALILFGIYRLAKENSFTWFRKRNRGEAATGQERNDDDPADLDEAIRKHTTAGDYKMAVRYMYLKVIRTSLEKNLAAIHPSSTNAEIVKAFSDPQQARDFRYLATAYEYIFFGDFIPSATQFSSLQKRFNQFHQNLAS